MKNIDDKPIGIIDDNTKEGGTSGAVKGAAIGVVVFGAPVAIVGAILVGPAAIIPGAVALGYAAIKGGQRGSKRKK